MGTSSSDVDEYIEQFDSEVQQRLQAVRAALHRAIPGADERISYQIPCLRRDSRNVIYFSGWKHHIGVYPLPALDGDLAVAMKPYTSTSAKATARFPHRLPLPIEMIEQLAGAAAESATTG